MTPRTEKLRQESLSARPSISPERAVLLTEFYEANQGRHSVPVMRAKSFLHLCEHKSLYIEEGEMVVGGRGPGPKQTPTFPELTCHSVEDLKVLNCRAKTHYDVQPETLRVYEEKIIPY